MSARDERGAAQPRARRFALRRLTSGPLSVQLAVLSGSITALVVFVGFWILSVETRTTARRVTAQELATSQRTQLELQRRTMDQLRLTTSLITQRPTVAYALSTYRPRAKRYRCESARSRRDRRS